MATRIPALIQLSDPRVAAQLVYTMYPCTRFGYMYVPVWVHAYVCVFTYINSGANCDGLTNCLCCIDCSITNNNNDFISYRSTPRDMYTFNAT